MSGLRKALAAKKIRTEHYFIPIAESDVVDPLAERLQQARNAAFRAYLGDDDAEKDRADSRVVEAKAEVDACFHRLDFQGLRSDADFNALVNAFPATPEQVEKANADGATEDDVKAMMDLDGFNVALLVACIVDGDGMTEAEWREELWSDRWTATDRKALFDRVMLANQRAFSDGIPNG